MLILGTGAEDALERLYFQAKAARLGPIGQPITLGFTVPAGLPPGARMYLLCGWSQNAAGPGTVSFGGTLLTGADEILPANDAPTNSTPCTAAYTLLDPPAGAQNAVLAHPVPTLGTFAAGLWIFGQIDDAAPVEATFQSNSFDNVTTVAGSLTTTAPAHLLSLAVAQGIHSAPAEIDGGYTELADGIVAFAASQFSDYAYQIAERAAPTPGTYPSTVTFSFAEGRGLVQVAVKGR